MPDTSSFYHNPVDHVTNAVYRHSWADLEDWVTGLDDLADLSDAEIEALVAEDGQQLPISQPKPAPKLLVLSDAPDLGYEKLATYTLLRLKGLDRLSALAEVTA